MPFLLTFYAWRRSRGRSKFRRAKQLARWLTVSPRMEMRTDFYVLPLKKEKAQLSEETNSNTCRKAKE